MPNAWSCIHLETAIRAMKAYRFPIRAQSTYSLTKLKLTQQTGIPEIQRKVIKLTYRYELLETTLNSPITVGYIISQTHSKFLLEIRMGHINWFFKKINVGDYQFFCYFCPIANSQCVGRKSSCRLRGRYGVFWTHVISTLTWKLVWSMQIISTVISHPH